jgi:hypothetical protein
MAQETGLSERAVCTHLEIAEQERWIHRAARKEGKGWKNYVYTLTTVRTEPRSAPSTGIATEPRSAGNPDRGNFGAEPGAVGTERHALGTEPDDNLALNDVQSNNVPNTSINKKCNTSVSGSPSASPAPNPLSDFLSNPEQIITPGEAKAYAESKRAEELRQLGLQWGVQREPRWTNHEYAIAIMQAQLKAEESNRSAET